jgi:hypothetical protein
VRSLSSSRFRAATSLRAGTGRNTSAGAFGAAPGGLFAALALLAGAFSARPALALNPERSITQYAHRVWTVGLNGLRSAPLSITQSADGYLLLGAQDGIYLF